VKIKFYKSLFFNFSNIRLKEVEIVFQIWNKTANRLYNEIIIYTYILKISDCLLFFKFSHVSVMFLLKRGTLFFSLIIYFFYWLYNFNYTLNKWNEQKY
jgi:hypothetical protein